MSKRKNYFDIIFFDRTGKAYKYHNIKKYGGKLENFLKFAAKKGGIYANLYNAETKQFVRQQKISQA